MQSGSEDDLGHSWAWALGFIFSVLFFVCFPFNTWLDSVAVRPVKLHPIANKRLVYAIDLTSLDEPRQEIAERAPAAYES